MINLTYEVPPSFISKAAASLSGSVKDVACPVNLIPPCVVLLIDLLVQYLNYLKIVDIVLFEPVTTILPVFSWSILLEESTIIAELAVSVPAVWSSISTYKSPPIAVTALKNLGDLQRAFGIRRIR